MKIKQSRSPNSRKAEIASVHPEADQTHLKPYNLARREDYLSPVDLKLAKERSKVKKQNKPKKGQESLQDKKTKRKEKRKCAGDLNSTILMNELNESKSPKKQLQITTKLKIKPHQKKAKELESKTNSKCEWFKEFTMDSTVSPSDKKKKKTEKSKMALNFGQEEYLFIGDQFYSVSNFCPTKRLLNTFREVCSSQDPTSKFIAQDKTEKSLLKAEAKKKTNIFLEARKEIQTKFKTAKAVIIQRWWRSYLKSNDLKNPKVNPEQIINVDEVDQKISFRESEDEVRSPFDIQQLDQSPIGDKQSCGQESIIASFNSAELLDQRQPKKIEFTKQNISNLMSNSYKLPQESEVNVQENDEIFNNYSQFKMKESSDVQPSTHPTENYNISFNKESAQVAGEKISHTPYNLLKEFQQATRIKQLIEIRVIEQKGQLKPIDNYSNKVGISTSILATHNFLVRFFNFYIQKYRDEFISLINMPYGYSVPARLRHLAGEPLPEEEEEDEEGVIFGLKDIIDSDKLEEYYSYFSQRQGQAKNSFFNANLELEKIHNRSVIDYFNQEINQYRPYRQIQGVPYPWNHSYKALTFYFVTEDNIAEIFEKVEIIILKSCSLLCGIHVSTGKEIPSSGQEFDLLQFMEGYEQSTHGLILQHNQDKQLKHLHDDIKKDPFEFDSQTMTGVMLEVSAVLFQDLVAQTVFQLYSLGQKKSIY